MSAFNRTPNFSADCRTSLPEWPRPVEQVPLRSHSCSNPHTPAPTSSPLHSLRPQVAAPVQLPRSEVIRRLRALGQPATLFGEDNGMRETRWVKGWH